MALSEIEKLERRYQENPQGLTFAPLAEAYRKSGDAQRALSVLTPGLELHPDYIPASIVLGRCHLDLKDDAAAELAFVHVLELDTENVIALKALADIAERGTRFGDSARWLEQLLQVDRSNDEAREQLERVRASHEQQAGAEGGAAAPGAEEAVADVLAIEGLETTSVGSGEITDDSFGEELPPLETVERETNVAAAEVTPPVEAFEPTHESPVEEAQPATADPSAVVLDDAILGVMQLGTSEEIVLSAAENTEFQLPSASEGLSADSVSEASSSASEYQLPSASDEMQLTPSAANGASEYQLPTASEELIPEASSANQSSEYQLPSASDDLSSAPSIEAANGGSEYQLPSASDELVPEATAANGASEFQLPDASSEFGRIDATPVVEAAAGSGMPAGVAEVFDADADEPDAATSEWVTWSDAALDADAEPFEAEPELTSPVESMAAAAAEAPPAEAPVEARDSGMDLAITEVIEIVSLAPEPVPAIEDDPVPAVAAEPELVITESMADLFLMQGHHADALRIFRELLARRPEDGRLAERIAALEAQQASLAPPLPPYAASSSGGTSVRELMRAVLGSRPNGVETGRPAVTESEQGGETPGTPTRPAGDHLTLSAIFGEDAAPLPPVTRKPQGSQAAPSERGGVSFDEFYGGPVKAGSSPKPAGSTRGVPGEDDLDQFHDWLQNLKR